MTEKLLAWVDHVLGPSHVAATASFRVRYTATLQSVEVHYSDGCSGAYSGGEGGAAAASRSGIVQWRPRQPSKRRAKPRPCRRR